MAKPYTQAGPRQLATAFDSPSTTTTVQKSYDAIVIGAGDNGRVSTCYLQRAGLDVLAVELLAVKITWGMD